MAWENFVSANEVVADIQDDLAFDGDEQRARILGWVFDALMDIGISHLLDKTVDIEVSDLSFDKPCDYVAPFFLELVTTSGGCIEPVFEQSRKYRMRKSNSTKRNNGNSTITISQDATSFFLSSNADDVTHARLQYYAWPIDDLNLPLIPYYAKLAVQQYCTYKWMSRERIKGRFIGPAQNHITRNDVIDANREWKIKKKRARGRLNSPESIKGLHQIGASWIGLDNRFERDFNGFFKTFVSAKKA